MRKAISSTLAVTCFGKLYQNVDVDLRYRREKLALESFVMRTVNLSAKLLLNESLVIPNDKLASQLYTKFFCETFPCKFVDWQQKKSHTSNRIIST